MLTPSLATLPPPPQTQPPPSSQTLQDTSEISADLRKAEIFINNRGSGTLTDGTWVGWENYRYAPPPPFTPTVEFGLAGLRAGRVSRFKVNLGFRV